MPTNTTSKLQPLDAGIIKTFKCKYKFILVQKYIDDLENYNSFSLPDIKSAIIMIRQAWDRVSPGIISNCWKHCGFINQEESEPIVINVIGDYIAKIGTILQRIDKDGFTAEEFTSIDETVCIKNLNDEEIIDLVKNDKTDTDENDLTDNNNIAPIIISHDDVKKSLQTITTFIKNRCYDEKDITTVDTFNGFIMNLLTKELVQGQLKFKKKLNFE